MKKPGSNQRPPNRDNNQRRNAKNMSRNGQGKNNNSNSQNRNSGNGRKTHTPHLWASSSSTALTSHLSIIDRRNNNGTGKNTSSKSGVGKPNGKLGGKSNRDHNAHNRNQGHSKTRYFGGKPKTSQQGAHRYSKNTSAVSAPQNKPTYNHSLESKTNTFGIDPFELFCAYHLGISPTNQYRPSNINEVANRFKLDTAITRQILKEYEMDSASLLDRDFDMAMAQLDIQVAPEGVNRTELARNIFENFLEAPIKKRDWKKILEEDKKENAKTFNPR